MRIALLSPTYPPDVGGLAISVERLARMLAAAGHRVHVFAPASDHAPGHIVHADAAGVTITRLGAQRRTDDALAAWFDAVVAAHAAEPFDLLHAYFVKQAGFVATYAGHYLGLPSVVSARGNDLDRAVLDPAKAAHTLYALQHASALTANSRDLARKAQALAPGRAVTLIPNSVDTTLFKPLATEAGTTNDERRTTIAQATENNSQFSILNSQFSILGFVGEARAKKGLAPLLVAFREVARARPAALLLVGGARPGDDAAMLVVFQKQHPDLPIVVVPYAPQDALPAYYHALDVLLLPSLQDGLPNAVLEGMACGCAIIGSAVGGIPDVLRHGENGLLVPPRDSDALVTAINALLDDVALRARLGAAARAAVLRDYAPEQELARNLTVYAQVGDAET